MLEWKGSSGCETLLQSLQAAQPLQILISKMSEKRGRRVPPPRDIAEKQGLHGKQDAEEGETFARTEKTPPSFGNISGMFCNFERNSRIYISFSSILKR